MNTMTLISLPDCKMYHEHLTLGADYSVEPIKGNGYAVTANNGEAIIILRERFEQVKGK